MGTAVTTSDRPAGEQTDSEGCFENNLGWLLAQAHFALATECRAAFEPLGISARGYHVLAAAQTGDHTQRELAEMVGLDKTTMVVTIDELEEAGFAERRPSSTDRRARVIGVTKAGRRKVKEGDALIAEIQKGVLGELPTRQREVLLEALSSLVRGRLSEPSPCSPPLRRR